MTKSRKAYILAGLSILFWGTSASAFKLALKEISVYQLLFVASLTSFFIFLAFIIVQKKIKSIVNLKLSSIALSCSLGILNPFAYYIILLNAYDIIPAQIAQPLNFTWPIVLVVLSAPLLKQKLSARSFVALTISFIGVYFVSSSGKLFAFEWANPVGIVLALGSSIFWAFYWILNLKDKKDTLIKLFFNFAFASVLISLLIWIQKDFRIPNLKGFLLAVYVGAFEMGFTFLFWLKALQLAGTTEKIGNLVYLTPFIALVGIHIILGEQIYITTFTGLILIVFGILYQQYSKKNRH